MTKGVIHPSHGCYTLEMALFVWTAAVRVIVHIVSVAMGMRVVGWREWRNRFRNPAHHLGQIQNS
ncbi:MAG: hypothetical protein PVS2B2_14130 [Candidatus Acidiferrum sp.]